MAIIAMYLDNQALKSWFWTIEMMSRRIISVTCNAALMSMLVLACNKVSAQQVCATPGRDVAGSISGTVNTYWQASANGSYGSGSSSIALTSKRGAATDIAVGDLVLVIQMQCADINSSDSDSYGDGAAGEPASGFSEPGTCAAGRYEYVRAGTGSSATTLALDAGARLTQTYIKADATTTAGRRTFQIIRVPQYQNVSLSGTLGAPVWDGVTGGVLAIDVADTLTMSGQVINVDGFGFRGGGGRARSANDATQRFRWDTDDRHASKAEGIAGTPRYVSLKVDPTTGGTAAIVDNGAAWGGYPSGTTSTGDYARGAPGNAGGGGAFWNATSDNGGGGGGGNGNAGGRGAAGWRSGGYAAIAADYSNHPEKKWGFGGSVFPAGISRLALGGGGGAGDNNNNSTAIESSGANGGGIVMIRAGTITGNGTISARGARAADNPLNDGAGGGGAGGSVIAIAGIWSPTLQINVDGGRGGDAWPAGTSAHGSGGGGAGGVVIRSGTASVSVNGGANGITNVGDTPSGGANHGAQVGGGGIDNLIASSSDTPGQTAGYLCQADLTITKTNNVTAPATLNSGQTIAYTIVISNKGQGRADGTIFADPAVTGLAVTAISCSVTAATATCPDLTNQATSIAALQGSGLVIPVLRANSVLTFTVTATVTATGF